MLRDKKKTVLLKTVALWVLGALALTGCADQTAGADLPPEGFLTAPAAKYQTVPVEKGTFIQTAVDTLSVIYVNRADISWDQDNAYYKEILVDKKQEVKAGDILVSFEIGGSEAQLESLRLQLQRAKEDRDAGIVSRDVRIREQKEAAEVLESYDREIALLKIEKLQVEYEQFLYQANQKVLQLEQSIAAIEEERQNNVIRAPFDGIINKVAAYNPGDKVIPGEIIISMYSPDQILLKTRKNADLRYNMPVTVEIGSGSAAEVFSGRVVAAPNVLPSSLKQDAVLIELEAQLTKVQLSTTKKVTCVLQELQDVVTVSREAIQSENDAHFVYILDGDTIRKRYIEVKTGLSATAWVLDGLTEGMTVIAD